MAFYRGKAIGSGILLVTFLLLLTKNAGSVFEQASPGPKGESHGWLSYRKVTRREGEIKDIRNEFIMSLKKKR